MRLFRKKSEHYQGHNFRLEETIAKFERVNQDKSSWLGSEILSRTRERTELHLYSWHSPKRHFVITVIFMPGYYFAANYQKKDWG